MPFLYPIIRGEVMEGHQGSFIARHYSQVIRTKKRKEVMFKIYLSVTAGWCEWATKDTAGEALGFVNQNKENAKNAGGKLVVQQLTEATPNGSRKAWREVEISGELDSPVVTPVGEEPSATTREKSWMYYVTR